MISLDIKNYLQSVHRTLLNIDTTEIEKAVEVLLEAICNQKTIYCFGNGGSASTASHFANDFNKILNSLVKDKFQFICLSDNMATVMAIANDISYDDIFSYQLQDRLKPGDVIIAISGSGNSKNIIKAVNYAASCGNTIIGLTGFDGGRLMQLADINLHAPIDNMQVTEDIHLLFNHLLVSVLSNFLS